MKKVMTIVMAAALTFAAASQASAAALETKGEFRGRYWYLSDYNRAITAHDDSQDFFDQRLRLNMNWQIADGISVGARADILENIGDISTNDTNTGANAKDEIDFDQAYAKFNTGTLAWTVGKQDVSWGTGIWVQADNRYRIKFATKIGGIGIAPSVDFLKETKDDQATDDFWGVLVPVSGTFGGWNTGAFVAYANNGSNAGVDQTRIIFDAFTKGAVGNIKINAEVAYATGEDDKDVGADIDVEALMAYAGAFLPIGPVNCGFEFAYSQGDDKSTADNEQAYSQDYQGAFNSFILFNNFDLDGWVSTYGTDYGVQNAMALKASGTFAMNKQLSFMGAVVWAQADETVANQEEDMGVEVDLLAKYALTENVTLQAGFGYLAAGDYFGNDVDDPWVGTAQAIVTF